jgi:uncharacterized protein
MINSILVDSSFLTALHNPMDLNHQRAADFIKNDKSQRLIPEVALPEVTFLMNRAGGIPAVASFLNAFVASHPTLQTLTWDDLTRAQAIMLTYARAEFDLVDCCIMALSERLNVQRVATFDRRDFSIFRPTHCEYLRLVP